MRAAASALIVSLLALLLTASAAEAASKQEASYPYEKVWPAAVRFLVIDAGVSVTDKDADTGYVLFELEDDNKTFKGALEVIRIRDSDGRSAVRLMLRLQDRPSYMETGMLKRLVRKLYTELGPPAPPPPARKPQPEPEPPADGDQARATRDD